MKNEETFQCQEFDIIKKVKKVVTQGASSRCEAYGEAGSAGGGN